MKLAAIFAVFGILLGLGFVAVRAGDRELFVSPPDARAEGFVRELLLERYAEARTYLAERSTATEAELRELHEALVSAAGRQPAEIEKEVVFRDQNHARVDVTLRSSGRAATRSFELEFHDAWQVTMDHAIPRPGRRPPPLHPPA